MPDMGKVRELLKAIHGLAVHLNDDEIQSIAMILYRATERLEKETEEG